MFEDHVFFTQVAYIELTLIIFNNVYKNENFIDSEATAKITSLENLYVDGIILLVDNYKLTSMIVYIHRPYYYKL